MASLSYVDAATPPACGSFVRYDIPDLLSSILEPAEPTEGLLQVERLVQLLLLSNHIEQAYGLLCVLHEHYTAILTSTTDLDASLQIWGRPLANFWVSHPTYTVPGRPIRTGDEVSARGQGLARAQWHEYRECTRTGWMLEHCNLPEPDDPHTWRETDDSPMIAMCARLLAKDKTPGQYPGEEALRESLAAAKKLYAQPQVPITEWQFKRDGRRHSYLLYRRLVVELCIRLGEFEAAADMLSLGLTLDGFNYCNGGDLDRYLYLPGIYHVLPLLAKRKTEGNPFYIEEQDASAMVEEIAATLQLRAQQGRQWSLAPEKVGWRELLDRLARGAWVVNRKGYELEGLTCAEEILHPPATEEEIREAEVKFGELPIDFKDMVRVANGFKGGWHFLSGGIAGIGDMELAGEDGYMYMFRFPDADHDVCSKLILLTPATECDGFMHMMVSPEVWRHTSYSGDAFKDGEYPYWHYASWIGGVETVWHTFRDWVAAEVENVESMVKRGETVEDGWDDLQCV
ncbi:hypothetical protein B0I35DRAFT_439831 [Stachybotrys elegans]|uniref:Knr4/Smi1-like domain-containing protein n=1 Tax=Stachybotrys elegans TaxID=80388 RepID=A0A8K0WMJ2_9HYPO|nr:hypothetical protein B0I35DRAFT_439831 [Stachybotrys elegans]